MPRVSPLATDMLTCWTAFTMPRRVENSTVRSLTSSSGFAVMSESLFEHDLFGKPVSTFPDHAAPSGAPLRIDDVAQAVAEQVEAEHRDHQRQAREQRDPPF